MMQTILKSGLLILMMLGSAASGQTPRAVPSTDIFLVNLTVSKGQLQLGQPQNITRRKGYDNQPMFFADGKRLLYTSIREDNQADIYEYDISKATTRQITATKESEYSPTVTPDGKALSVIRVEADQTQRLWQFPLAGGNPALLLEKTKPVGYHLWVNQSTLLLFILGQPDTLQLIDAKTEKAEPVIERPGRTLQMIPHQQKVSFVHKLSDSEWLIKSFDLQTRQVAPLMKTLPGKEYYAWTPEGILLMGKDAKLFKWDARTDKDWQEVADLSAFGIRDITRIAVSPKGDSLALVAQCDEGC
jgi:dipeptidyl aminopeptidase/acylaminoacyl peptidase